MKINQPTDNSLYVTIGNFTYYFDDSIEGEVIVKRWRTDKPMPIEESTFFRYKKANEDLQETEDQ